MSELEMMLKMLAMLSDLKGIGGDGGQGKWPGVYLVLTDEKNEPLFQFRQTPDREAVLWAAPCGNPDCDDQLECGRKRLLMNWRLVGSWIAEAKMVASRDEAGGDMIIPVEAGPPSAVYTQAEEWLNSLEALDD